MAVSLVRITLLITRPLSCWLSHCRHCRENCQISRNPAVKILSRHCHENRS